MSILSRLTPSTRGAWRRTLILTVYIVVLAVAGWTHSVQNRADTVILYVQGNVAYARALSEDLPRPLFPLADECDLSWSNGAQSATVAHDQMAVPVTTVSNLLQDITTGLRFSTVGDLSILPGLPWVTIQSKLGDVQVKADCPPPAPTTHHVYLYVQGRHLFSYDTLNGDLRLIMPLRDLLLWSGDETWVFTLNLLVVRDEDRQGYSWLPDDAIVLGDFETAWDVVVHNLDDTQVQIRYGSHELMLVSYDR